MPSIATKRTLRASTSALSVLLAGVLVAFVSPAAIAKEHAANRGMESVHQPTVSRTDFVFDVSTDYGGTLTASERSRLVNWFDAVRLGYGDRVAIANTSYEHHGLVDAVANLVARYGLILSDDAPLTAGEAQPGSIRIVVSRSVATVEGCPAWRDKSETDLTGALGDNYGCAIAGNLAAMIADPQDLVEGRSTHSLRTWVGSRAIQTYREKAPTGSGDLKTMGN